MPGRGDDLTPPPMRLDEAATAGLVEVAGRYGTTFPPLLRATPRRRDPAARGTAGPRSRASTPRRTTRGDQPRRAVADPRKPDVTSSIRSIWIGQRSISNWKDKFPLGAVGGSSNQRLTHAQVVVHLDLRNRAQPPISAPIA